MAKHIAQVTPRRASRALLRTLLKEVRTINASAAKNIAQCHLGKTPDEIANPDWLAPLGDNAFADAFAAGMAVLIEHCAQREKRLPMTRQEYALLCHCVITCTTLREVIERAASFMRVLASQPGELKLHLSRDTAEFCIYTDYGKRDAIGLLTDLAGLAAFHRLFAWLIDSPVELLRVRMCYPALIDSDAASFMIPYPITFMSDTNAFRFSVELLDRPVLRSPQQLRTLLQRFPFDLNDTSIAHDTHANRVRSLMGAALARPEPIPHEKNMAQRLGISLSTLKRRLQSENTSYRAIRDTLLCTIAIECLENDRYSIGALATRLGFADTGSFRHAFKRWTGQAPGHYLKKMAEIAASR